MAGRSARVTASQWTMGIVGGLITSPPPSMARLGTGLTEGGGRRKGVHRIGGGRAPGGLWDAFSLPCRIRRETIRSGTPIMSIDCSMWDYSEPPLSGLEPDGSAVAFQETFETKLGELFIGARVCVRGRPRICGEIVQIMPKMGRVVVRFDPPHPNGRGRLRSLRPGQLVIYS